MRKLRRLIRDVIGNLRREPTTTLATVLTASVALTLLGVAMLANAQIAAMKDYWYDKVEVSVFLCTQASTTQTCAGEPDAATKQAVYDQLTALPAVSHVWFESRDDAWKMFTERFAGTPLTDGVTAAALPESFRVKLTDPSRGSEVEQAMAGVRGVEQVQDQRKVLARFFGLLEKVQGAAAVIAATALAAAAVLIAAGVRVAIAHRRREIAVMRLVGASAGTIRRPFLLASVLQGAAGGAAAAATVLALKAWFLDAQVGPGSLTRTVDWAGAGTIALLLLAAGTATATTIAAFSLRRHLRQ